MFDFLCYQPTDSYLPKRGPSSNIRILHAAPAARRIDMYASGHTIAKNLSYKKYTPYFPIPSGPHNMRAYCTGTRINPNASMDMTLDNDLIYTLAVIGSQENTEIFPIHDSKPADGNGFANVRLVNLSPAYPALDIAKPDGKILFPNAGYKSIMEYILIEPGKHSIQIRQPGTSGALLTVPDVTFKPDWNYTIYLTGLHGEKPSIHVLILLDGSTYINNK